MRFPRVTATGARLPRSLPVRRSDRRVEPADGAVTAPAASRAPGTAPEETDAEHARVRQLPNQLAAAAAALVLGALIWFLATAENSRRLHEMGGGDEARDFPFFSSGRQLSYWLSFWIREHEELGEVSSWSLWIQPEDRGAVTVQIALLVVLCAVGTLRVLRALPPTARRWPVTLLGCWGAAALSGLLAAALAALVRDPEEHHGRGEMLGLFTSAALPVPAALGLVAAVIGTGAAAAGRRRLVRKAQDRRTEAPPTTTGQAAPLMARSAETTPEHRTGVEPGTGPGQLGSAPTAGEPAVAGEGFEPPAARRQPVWGGIAAGVVFAAVALGLGHLSVVQWLLHQESGADRLPYWLVDVVMPGFWHWDGSAESGVAGPASLLTLIAQAVLAGGLFWLVARQLVSRALLDYLLTGAWTGLLAGLLARPTGEQLGAVDDQPLMMSVRAGFQFAPGACVVGLLGGAAAWLVHRNLLRLGSLQPDQPAGARPSEGPDDELVIRLSR